MPELIWDSVSYEGNIYMLPAEISQDGHKMVISVDSSIKDQVKDAYNGNIMDLDKVVSPGNKFYYAFIDFSFAESLGYHYDMVRGTLFSQEGKAVNPFEVPKIIDWMKLVNKWYREGSAKSFKSTTGKAGCTIELAEISVLDMDKLEIIDSWDIPLFKRYKCSTAIREDSQHKDEAFKLLELFRTNHEYGNLLIYGTETADDIENIKPQKENCTVFGLDDGLMHPKDNFVHFGSADERKEFFKKNVKASPSLYIDIPVECTELVAIVRKYLSDEFIIFSDSFDEKLEQFKTEYTEAFDRIFKDYK